MVYKAIHGVPIIIPEVNFAYMDVIKNHRNEYFLIAAFVAVFLLTHLPRLATDSVNSDALLWHKRSEAFVTALKAHDFAKTYQKYHPGVTLMWISGSAFEFSRDTFYNFEVYDYAAKIFLVFKQIN